ncbi:Carboxypeptidase B [Eumeta japonica]|uniref:Carboxypeptidase B n=1 Tax=Eumeta variegata TaxID=151549 RepID=A0A4C1SSS0_EUMVA|nr:Carboxypeptidase B [Eumeta japonica]
MKLLGLVFLLAVAYAKHEIYDGWKSYYVGPSSQEHTKALGDMVVKYELDFLSDATLGREGVVLVKPKFQKAFTEALEELGINYRIHTENVKLALERDDEKIEKRRQESMLRNEGRSLPYDNYQEWETIDEYIQDIARRYPETVTLVTPANTFEGRPIRYLKISTTNFEDTSKPVIFIDGGIHVREWISPPSVTWAIHKLVEDITEPDLLEDFDWIILPVVNPDGYKYTFTHERFWRKTRSTDQHALSFICPGVDGNRNYDFFWNTVGTSNSPCSDVYAGSRAFSEIETRVVRDVIHEYLPRMSLYLTMHSYGRFPRYLVGNSVHVIGYPTAGASEDYAHLVGVPLSYTYELPGLSPGFDGFHLDPIWIEQVCWETWLGIVVGARRSGQLFGRK